MTRRRLAGIAVWLAAASAAGALSGCGDSPAGEYRDYTALDAANDEAADESDAEPPSDSEDVAAATSEDDQAADADSGETEPRTTLAEDEPAASEITPVAATVPGPADTPVTRTDDVEPAAPASTTAAPGGLTVLVPEKTFRGEGSDGTLRVSYDDLDLLKVLNAEVVPVDVVDHMPQWLKGLDGQRIRIRGWMYPPLLSEGLKGFTLARDNQICCFGRDPKPYDLIRVRMRPGVTTDYIANRPFDVVGVFRLDPVAYSAKDWEQLYVIEDAVVIDR